MTLDIILIIIHICHGTNYKLIIRWIKCNIFDKMRITFLINMPVPFSRDSPIFGGYESLQVQHNIVIDINKHMVLTNENKICTLFITK